jgi:hypothetical protein
VNMVETIAFFFAFAIGEGNAKSTARCRRARCCCDRGSQRPMASWPQQCRQRLDCSVGLPVLGARKAAALSSPPRIAAARARRSILSSRVLPPHDACACACLVRVRGMSASSAGRAQTSFHVRTSAPEKIGGKVGCVVLRRTQSGFFDKLFTSTRAHCPCPRPRGCASCCPCHAALLCPQGVMVHAADPVRKRMRISVSICASRPCQQSKAVADRCALRQCLARPAAVQCTPHDRLLDPHQGLVGPFARLIV